MFNHSHSAARAYQKWEPAGCKDDFGNFFPSYHIGADCSDWTVFMKTFYNIICCAKEVRVSIALNIEWVQPVFVLQNCEKLQKYRFKKDKKEQNLSEICRKKQRLIVLCISDVMYKK